VDSRIQLQLEEDGMWRLKTELGGEKWYVVHAPLAATTYSSDMTEKLNDRSNSKWNTKAGL